MLIEILSGTHNITTLLFGIYISAFFLGVKQNRENILKLFMFFACDGILFIVLYLLMGSVFTDNILPIYPFITHLPLIIFLHIYYKYPVISCCISVFSAYLCCQISNWGGLFILNITDSECYYYTIRIIITVVVFFLLCKYVCSTTASIFEKSIKELCMIGLLPFVYYVFDYAFTKFSDLLYSGSAVVVEFYGFAFCISYIVFLFIYFREYEQKRESKQYGDLMEIQLHSVQNEIDNVRASEKALSIYRHDMRHHMNILHMMIGNGNTDGALEYINKTVGTYDDTVITRHCHNEMINSVISIYKMKYHDRGIELNCNINCNDVPFSEIDFCAILSNALENSMHAVENLSNEKKWAGLTISNKNGTVLLRLQNPTVSVPKFIGGVPVSNKEGHGIGVKSIIHYVEKLNGQWHFSVSDNTFIMQVII